MQCGGTAPAIMQNGQDHMEESERYCRKCDQTTYYQYDNLPVVHCPFYYVTFLFHCCFSFSGTAILTFKSFTATS